jgi:hypothetical protein
MPTLPERGKRRRKRREEEEVGISLSQFKLAEENETYLNRTQYKRRLLQNYFHIHHVVDLKPLSTPNVNS